jgi:tetratricopeptide (TPR) repeat protein
MATERKSEEWLESALRTPDPVDKLEWCKKYLKANPEDSDVWEYSLRIASALGNEDEQSNCSKNAAMGRGVKHNLGRLRLGVVDSSAVDLFSQVLDEDSGQVDAWLGKIEALNNLKRYQESMISVEKVLTLNPRGFALAYVWLMKGESLDGLGRLNEALECYDKALGTDVGNYRALISKAATLFDLERYEEAIACWDQLLRGYQTAHNPDLAKTLIGYKEKAQARIQEKRRVQGKETGQQSADRPDFCAKCGNPLLKGANFCTKCGIRIA